MTWALENQTKTLVIPEIPGVSARSVRAVVGAMARRSQADGTFRYGFSARTIAAISDYSIPVVRRVHRWVVEAGILEKLEVGGGRKATKWRIAVDVLLSFLPAKTHQPEQPDTPDVPQRHTPRARTGLSYGLLSRGRDLGSRLQGDSSPAVLETCVHGGDAGRNRFGPKCPDCKRLR